MNFRVCLFTALFIASNLSQAEVRTQKLELQEVPVTRQFDGVVEAVNSATVSGQTSGRVADILFDVGDRVNAGAVIIRLVSEDQQGNLQQAEAALAEAKAGLKVEQLEMQRIQALFEKGVVAKADVDRAQGKVESRQAQVNSAEGALRRARQQLDYTVIKAPFGGVVSERHVELGEAVSPGVPLMSGFDPQQLRVLVTIPQAIASRFDGAPTMTVQTRDQTIKPEKIRVYPVANPVNGTVKARLNLAEGTHGLLPGQWVKVAVELGRESRLLIPQSAVLQRSQISNVYIQAADGLQLRNVRLGKRHGDHVAVSAGLDDGDILILNPLDVQLKQTASDGDKHE